MDTSLNRYQQTLCNVAGCSAVVTCFVLPISTSVTTILFALTALFTLLSGVYIPQVKRWLRNPASVTFIIAYALVLLGATYSIGSHHDVSKALLKYSRFIQAWLILPVFFHQRWRRWALWAFLAAMVVTLIGSYLHYYIWPNYQQRVNFAPASTFKDNIVQSYLFALAIALLLPAIGRYTDWRRWLVIALVLLMLFDNFAMSQSRTGYIITMVVMVYWGINQLKGAQLASLLVGVIFLLLAAYFGSSTFQSRLDQAWHNSVQYHQHRDVTTAQSAGLRMEMLYRSWWLFKQRPWAGYGTGSQVQANTLYNQQHPDQPAVKFANSNTIYLNVAVLYGVGGFLLLLVMLVALWWCARYLPDNERYFIRVLLLCLAIGGLFNSWFSDTTQAHAFVLFSALCYGAWLERKVPEVADH